MINFSDKYDRNKFKHFLKNFLPQDLIENNEELKIEENNSYFRKAILLGSVKSLDGLVIIEIERKKSEKSRITITKELFKFLELYGYSKALVITFSEKESHYRFSLIKSELNWTGTKVDKEFSNPKRLSFLLGVDSKVHTATKHLINQGRVKTFDDLYSRFNIEIVNEEFYKHYKNLFLNLTKKLDKDKEFSLFAKKNNLQINHFAKKLLGQIVFCYFLQKKGWLGVEENKSFGTGDNSFLRNKFEQIKKEKKNFFNNFLEFFFYQGLNNQNKNDYVKEINCRAPYVGGGLFEYYEGYDWKKETLNISNSTFSNSDNDGILDIFELYNFTVDESETIDVEISIDPEMLGRVFENLLDDNIRSEGGAFYTPRVIVNYMAQKSLLIFLKRKLNTVFNNEELENFILKFKFDKSKNSNFILKADLIDETLSNIKICDPAIGSGAFAIGMMNIIVKVRMLLKEFTQNKYKKNQYYFKRAFIQKNIYGVDIDASAVEITKLRLWLSLIVEDTNYDTIDPLPNLEFKIVQGNSLIETYEGINFGSKIFDNQEQETLESSLTRSNIEDSVKTLAKLQNTFIETISYKKKQVLKKEIKEIMLIILNEIVLINANVTNKKKYFSKLKDEIISNNKKDFFPWGIIFTEIFYYNKGFDLVISNPPYVNTKEVSKLNWKKELKKNFGFIDDLYNHFILLGKFIVKDEGLISYIASDTLMTLQSKKNIREILTKYKLIEFLKTPKAFKALVDTCIFFLEKELIIKDHKIRYINLKDVGIDEKKYSKDENHSWEDTLKSVFEINLEQKTTLIPSDTYSKNNELVIFDPSKKNLKIRKNIIPKLSSLYQNYWAIIKTSSAFAKNKKIIDYYNNKIEVSSLTLMGLITNGGQGLATGNNGEFVGLLEGTESATRAYLQRTEKLFHLIKNNKKFKIKFKEFSKFSSLEEVNNFVNVMNEKKIRILFSNIKKEFGRDIFGQGFLYRIINKDEVGDINALTEEEKKTGILDDKKIYVKYDKGDKEGNQWYGDTPYYIKWDKQTVSWFITNSGRSGIGMPVMRNKENYFKKGFCWSAVLNPNSKIIKCKINNGCVYDVNSMTLNSINKKISNEYLIALINSNYVFNYLRSFLNSSAAIQINDIRRIPVVVPSQKINEKFKEIFIEAKKIKLDLFNNKSSEEILKKKLYDIQNKIDLDFEEIYNQI